MRKRTIGAAMLAMAFAAVASADQLDLQVLANGSAAITAANDDVVNISIQGGLSAVSGAGLALWGVNVDADSSTFTGAFDITDTAQFLVTAPAGVATFDRNLGFTNPPGPPSPVTGYSGTPSGTVLLQVGGGQNTIGNMDPPAYPVGSVTTGVANAGAVDLATGTLTVPSTGDGDIIISLSACFANVLDAPAVGPPFAVSAATCTMGNATITVQGGLPLCNDADVNCDGVVNASDIAVIQNSANWLNAPTDIGVTNPRANVNGDAIINASDIAVVQNGANWLTSTGPCDSPDCP